MKDEVEVAREVGAEGSISDQDLGRNQNNSR